MSGNDPRADAIEEAIRRANEAPQPVAVLSVQFMPSGEPLVQSQGNLTSWHIYSLVGLLEHLGEGLFGAEVRAAQKDEAAKRRLVVPR